MTVEVRPIGETCNIKCVYCYQEGIRAAGNVQSAYSVAAMIDRLERIGEPFTLFGGEIMMLRDADLERLLAYGFERHGGCGLQTNGTLVEPHHLDLFERYEVSVGISIDGPGPLNDARWAGTLAATRRATARTEALIETLVRRGRPPSIIITLHQGNVGDGRIEMLGAWLGFLDALGIARARLHVLEVDTAEVGAELSLSPAEGLAAMRTLRGVERGLARLRFDIFAEVEALLRFDDAGTTCIFNACDSYATRAVTGVEGDGRLTNCGRTNKDGIGYLKAESAGYDRLIALHETPFEDGGCRDCRFFLACKGNCPGTAREGDWRLRSADCDLWFALFEDAERDLVGRGVEPLSLAPDRTEIERFAVQAWSAGLNPTLQAMREALRAPRGEARAEGRLEPATAGGA
jgi:uncharacterized protein